ncbi:MAG: AsnC family transcriptional regulator [Burkholderiales bacterium]
MTGAFDSLDPLDRRLLNDFQRGFPLTQRPFAAVAARVGASERDVLERYRRLAQSGIVSRIGVVFRPNAAGASTLAALAAPAERIEAVAAWLSAQPEVNHNYEREHRFNLWFVLTAPSQAALDACVARIECDVGLPMLVLPLEEEFHIDLGFDLRTGRRSGTACAAASPGARVDEFARPLIAALQDGLPLVRQPYAALARAAGTSAGELMRGIGRWLEQGVARRVGVVVRHGRLGFEANAMVVWDAPDASLGRIGAAIAAEDFVTLCYRRPRRLPEWPYNLFCMIHGLERGAVLLQVAGLRDRLGIAQLPYEVLFSTRCFKQRGARYAAQGELAHG